MNEVRVLIAEDNADHLYLATHALRSIPGVRMEVATVRDGEEALEYLHGEGPHADRSLPHLVLLDLSMPRKGGLDVLREVKHDAALSHIPVVVLTSSNRPEDINAAYDLGANCYVQKSQGLSSLASFWTTTADLPTH